MRHRRRCFDPQVRQDAARLLGVYVLTLYLCVHFFFLSCRMPLRRRGPNICGWAEPKKEKRIAAVEHEVAAGRWELTRRRDGVCAAAAAAMLVTAAPERRRRCEGATAVRIYPLPL